MNLRDIKREFDERPHHPFYPQAVAYPPRKKYLIAITPRSGSTRLAMHLARGSVLGYPGEFLNEGFIANIENFMPPPNLADFENFVLSKFTSHLGVFGLKADWWRYQAARQLGYLANLYSDLDLVIILKRRDFVRQAISLRLSIQTGIWHDHHARFSNLENVYENIAYDESQIVESLISIIEGEYRWRMEFRSGDIRVLEIFYEDISEDLRAVERDIAKILGVPCPVDEGRGCHDMQRVPSTVNDEWRDRFMADNLALVEACHHYRGRLSPVDCDWADKARRHMSADAYRPPALRAGHASDLSKGIPAVRLLRGLWKGS